MADKPDHARRSFLRQAGAAAGAAAIGISLPRFLSAARAAEEARLGLGSLTSLNRDEAVEIDAIAACVVPTTDTPGAREAGAIYFIDSVLGTGRPDLLEPIRAGLADLQARARLAEPPAQKFSELEEASQVALLIEIEKSDFFSKIRLLTLAGMFADPSYGGNRDRIGWGLIGFEGHFGTQPPFGWYDARYGAVDD